MFALFVVLSFLGIVILPVVFLLDPLEVKKRTQRTSMKERSDNTIVLPRDVDHHAAASRAK